MQQLLTAMVQLACRLATIETKFYQSGLPTRNWILAVYLLKHETRFQASEELQFFYRDDEQTTFNISHTHSTSALTKTIPTSTSQYGYCHARWWSCPTLECSARDTNRPHRRRCQHRWPAHL